MTRFITPVVALVLALLTFGASYFVYADIGTNAALIKDSRDKIAAVTARDTFAKTAAQFLAETTAERNAIQFFITPADSTAQAIELVEAAGKLAGVKASVGNATLSPLGTSHELITVTASAEGTYAGLARFGTVLESLPRASSLKGVHLSLTEKGWYGTFEVTFVKQK